MTIMQHDQAETLAYSAVRHLLEDDNLRDRFLNLSGLDGHDIRERISDHDFLAGLLEFFVKHEPDLLMLADALDVDPNMITLAWHVLDGEPNAI